NWPSFRGARAAGGADGANLPLAWDAAKPANVRWKTPIPGLAHSSPVVWGDRVFVTTAISAAPDTVFKPGLYGDVDVADEKGSFNWKVYALDRKTGKILWERTAHEGVPRVKRHIKASHANSTPAVDGKHLVVLFGSEGLYCYDLDGKLLWERDLGVLDVGWFYDPSYQWEYAASPVIHGDLAIVQADTQKDAFIAAYRLDSGEPAWRTSRDDVPSWSTPTVVTSDKRTEIVANGGRYIRSYDPANGKELWRLSSDSEVPVSTPVAEGGLIYVTDGYRPKRPLYAVRPGASGDISLGEGKTSSDWVAWSWPNDGTYIPTPLAYAGHVYTLANQGILSCYDAKSGERQYRQRVGGAFTASPVAADGKLYLASEEGDVHVIKAGPTYELLAKNPIGEVLMATPALVDGLMVVRGQFHVYGIGTATPEP
ncbi:MAG TPA: PQQ-binding-like beta-propeller repeat protein, partial [Candidatus Polarisedimenticolaceae bacterium]|nr:PQQ-binding-like beta-propeller repeat protein [Candidatus Polarisedimenticolaceae bacterium]